MKISDDRRLIACRFDNMCLSVALLNAPIAGIRHSRSPDTRIAVRIAEEISRNCDCGAIHSDVILTDGKGGEQQAVFSRGDADLSAKEDFLRCLETSRSFFLFVTRASGTTYLAFSRHEAWMQLWADNDKLLNEHLEQLMEWGFETMTAENEPQLMRQIFSK